MTEQNKNFIFEIGTEELPARFIPKGIEQLLENAKKILEREALKYEKVEAFGTPRRLILVIYSLSENQSSRVKVMQGPAKRVAFDDKGVITKAGEGFAKGQNVSPSELQIRVTEKGEYVFVEKKEEGENTNIVLKRILPELVKSLNFPKTMKWSGAMRFPRPIRWYLALFDTEIVEFNIEEITSNRITYGHRLLKNEPVEINSADEYFIKIKKAYVVIDPAKREKIILSSIKKIAKDLQAKAIVTKKLLNEVVNLVEFPVVLVGDFDKEFLEVPKEVLVESMTSHQKYFPIEYADGSLVNKFILVANNKKDKNIIKEGNERVLKARLSDARFFYHEDMKVPLIQKIDKLKSVVFQEALGTMFEKSLRIENLSSWIVNALGLSDIDEQVKRSAKLCKIDLVTEMVKEFTDLQGMMGKIYAEVSGESKEISDAIFEHYLPRSSGDKLPEGNIGSILSIADKVDTISGCFVAGLIPSGSEDPYALRRSATGIIEIMLNKSLNFSIEELAFESLKNFTNIKSDIESLVIDFIKQRLNYILQEKGFSYDILESLLSATNAKIPYEIYEKAQIIEKLKSRPDMIALALSFKRITNITLEYKSISDFNENNLKEDAERNLYNLYKEVNVKIEQDLKNKDYNSVTEKLLVFATPLEEFFTKVLVMDAEPYKTNRISLLKNIRELFIKFADFSKLVVQK